MKEISVILGTRPEIIKMFPVIRALEKRRASFFVLHTGQHYSYNLDRVFFEQLGLPDPEYNLEVGSGSHARQTARMLTGIEKVLLQEKPSIVLVEGDTNSVLAGALVATKLQMKVGHVEAGLRSYDRTMPEEVNRILTDHCSDYLFAPTGNARSILLDEGIPPEKVFVTGNTIVDVVYQQREAAKGRNGVLARLGLNPGEYFLLTLHRQENVDDRTRLASILEGLRRVSAEFHLPVIFPIHPRSQSKIAEFKLDTGALRIMEPVDFWSFLHLESGARLILTDSGGVQEESCVLGVPCVTLRDNTERPETVEVGGNILAGTRPERILECVQLMLSAPNSWSNPFGDGHAGERIADIVTAEVRLD